MTSVCPWNQLRNVVKVKTRLYATISVNRGNFAISLIFSTVSKFVWGNGMDFKLICL